MPRGIYQHNKGYKRPPFSEKWKKNMRSGQKGKRYSESAKNKMSEARKREWANGKRKNYSGEKAIHWKGDSVGYRGIHHWINKILKKPKNCELCDRGGLTGRKIHWANLSGNYKRDVNDWASKSVFLMIIYFCQF